MSALGADWASLGETQQRRSGTMPAALAGGEEPRQALLRALIGSECWAELKYC